MIDQINNPVIGVPKQIFIQLLKKLDEEKIPTDVITRLNKTLVEQGDVSETAIKTALFSDNNTNT
jgi:hypothetical protein